MPRDSSGNYSLPAGNPVQSGTVITSTWANSTLDDVSSALSDSLDRYGRGGMLAPFEFSDGTNFLPGATWTNETSTGLYRFDGGDLRMSVLTQDIMRWQNTGAQVWNIGLGQWEEILTAVPGFTGVPVGTLDLQILEWNDGISQWGLGAPLVKVPAGNANNQIIEWNNATLLWELGVQSGGGAPINPGTADGNMVRWEDTPGAWEETTAIRVNDAGNILVSGLVDGRDIAADGSELDSHVADNTIHFTVPSISHTLIQNIGVNNHVQIDEHIADIDIHFGDAPNDAQQYARQSLGWSVVEAPSAGLWELDGDDITPTNPGVVEGTWSNNGGKNALAKQSVLTQAQYDGLTPDINTIYYIVG
jgi:hypothetical protein